MFARSFTFSTQSDQKSFVDGNRFLAPVDFPLGYINPRISANALAEPHLAGFERLKAFSTSARSCSISRIYSSQVVTRASAGAGLRSHHYYAASADASSEIFASALVSVSMPDSGTAN